MLGAICCTDLWHDIYNEYGCKEHANNECSRSSIEYWPEKRRFSLKSISNADLALGEKTKRLIFYQFYHCPKCGTKLPSSLAREWFEIVTKEFDVKDIFNQAELQKNCHPNSWPKSGGVSGGFKA